MAIFSLFLLCVDLIFCFSIGTFSLLADGWRLFLNFIQIYSQNCAKCVMGL